MKLFVLALSTLALGACAAPPSPGAPADNECRASDHQYLIGRRKSEIPATPAGAIWRVTCSTCAVTMDYNPRRLNIVYDDTTGVVTKVACG